MAPKKIEMFSAIKIILIFVKKPYTLHFLSVKV